MLRGVGSSITIATVALALAACGRRVLVVESGEGGAETWGPAAASVSGSTSVGGVGGGGPGLVELDLGRRKPGPVTAVVASGTLGVTMVARASDDATTVGFSRLVAPSGAFVVDGPLPGNHATWNRVGISSMAAPQIESPESFPLSRGVWTFEVTSTEDVHLSAWLRRTSDGAFHGGVVDLNVFASAGVTKKKHVLSVAADAFADFGGLELGDVRFFDLGDGFLTIDESNLPTALAATTRAPTRPAIDIIATRMIGGKYEGSAGYSTGIPGSPLAPGSRGAAIVWMVTGDVKLDPIVLRHEAGHFAGLFHTSEIVVGEADTLIDTPSCEDPLSTFAQCPDFDYAMFPTGGSGVGLFSPRQTAVMQGSAIYRGVFAEGEAPMTPYGPPLGGTPTSAEGFGFGELASGEELAEARRAAAVRSHERLDFSWAKGLAPGVGAALAGVGCATEGEVLLDSLARSGVRGDELLTIADDRAAPALVRARALRAASKAGALSPRATEVAARLSVDATEAPLVRAFALRSLASLAPDRARAVAAHLTEDEDELVAATATRL
jgi:hypothetical protein